MADMEDLRRNMADLASMNANAERSRGEIRKAAEDRHAAVQARLEELRPKTLTDPDGTRDEYMALIEERGQLEMVLADR